MQQVFVQKSVNWVEIKAREKFTAGMQSSDDLIFFA